MLAIACLLPLGAAALPASAADIAVSLPLTGKYGELAKQFSIGMKLAIEELPEDKRPELLVIDDGCNGELGKLAAEEIAASDVRLATGYLCNDPAFVAAEVLKSTGIPLLITGARSSRLTAERGREGWNLFRASPADADAPKAAFMIFSQRWKGKPFAILDDGSMPSRNFADEFRTYMEEAGFAPAYVGTYRPGQESQSRMVARLTHDKIAAILITGEASDFAVLAKELNRALPGIEMAGTDALAFLPLLDTSKAMPEGILAIATDAIMELPETRQLDQLLERAAIAPEPMIFSGFSAMQLALAALSETRDETTNALKTKEFATIFGPVKFDGNGANIHNPWHLFQFQNGRFSPAKTIEAN